MTTESNATRSQRSNNLAESDLGGDSPPTHQDVLRAAERIAPFVHRTPVLTSSTLNHMVGGELFFKCENFQKIGAFKARGAHNAVFVLAQQQLERGLVTHSSGNHAAALALAAKNAGTTAHVVMPSNSSKVKIESVERLGGVIKFCEPTTQAREEAAAAIVAQTSATMIHPFDNWKVIAGQATASHELLSEVSDLEAIIAPVGGGGLLAGTSIVGARSKVAVYGAEPAGADDAYRSFTTGSLQPVGTPNTVADGLRTSLGARPFELIKQNVTGIITVSEEVIIEAMRLIWSVMKIVVEPSCAVTLAVLLSRRSEVRGKRIGIILSGGNVDLDQLPWLR